MSAGYDTSAVFDSWINLTIPVIRIWLTVELCLQEFDEKYHDFEEDEYDALNDETFGADATGTLTCFFNLVVNICCLYS